MSYKLPRAQYRQKTGIEHLSCDFEIFGQNKTILAKSGTPLDDMDHLIGATALAHGLTLVTHNLRHFSRIPKLKVEDWLNM